MSKVSEKLKKLNDWCEKHAFRISLFFLVIWTAYLIDTVMNCEEFYRDVSFYIFGALFLLDGFVVVKELIKGKKETEEVVDKT